jgi:hypothetical protein
MIETENHGMSLIRNRRGFLGALFSALLALALFDPRAATAQEAKQIKLTEKHIQGVMAAYKDMAKLYEGMNSDKPDPQVEAQAEAIAKKNGFVSLDEYDDVSMKHHDEYHDDHVRHRPADQEVHRATRTDQEGDRGAQS